ncbi:hypothetical protein NHX12_016517 [Muraenolepis orangiensis]|uniref:Uncharacterized protein n=1 Tax=Muraenolepis orangiensis TaxID=630683 RepID=A0A9Q0D4B7_9TELE|nr:hypothetical protein NHX12_016517 [Muraenolepis orangiensis]
MSLSIVLSSSRSPPPTDQQYSWSSSQHFDEDTYSTPPRNMKGLSGGRQAQLQLTSAASAHTCGLADCERSLDHHLHHGESRSPSYLLSPTQSCPLDGHHRCSPRSSIHSECMVMPVSVSATDQSLSSSTFPRMHYGSAPRDGGGGGGNRESREESGGGGGCGGGGSGGGGGGGSSGLSSHCGSGKSNRLPANMLDQFEKQMPVHRDGFHTLQYQRTTTTATTTATTATTTTATATSTTTTTEPRNESPAAYATRCTTVQRLFTKSHSLPSGGRWSSDDNLDSDSTYRTPSVMSRHPPEHLSHCYPLDAVQAHLAGDLTLKTSRSNNDV